MFIYLYFLVFAAAFGLLVGSFLNVLIYRLPHGEGVVRGRSRCRACGTDIAWYDNIPVLSYLILRGRCRHCGAGYSARYVLIELLTGVVSVAVFWHVVPISDLHHVSPALGDAAVMAVPVAVDRLSLLTWLHYFLCFAGLIAIFFVDLDHFIVPNEITFTLVPLGIAGSVGLWFLGANVPSPLQSVGGAVGGALLLLAVGWGGAILFRREAMGMGDVKLLAVIGAYLGAWPQLVVVILLAAVSGAVIGIAMRFLGKAHKGVPEDPGMVGDERSGDPGEAESETEIETETESEIETEIETESESESESESDDEFEGYYIPFGPFLVAAAFATFLVGDLLIGWYQAFVLGLMP